MHFTRLSAWTIPKQVFDYSQGSVRAGQHVLQQQLVGEHLRRQNNNKKKNSNTILFEITNNRGDGMLKSNGRAADPAHLSDDAETGLVQGRGAPTLSQTELQGFLPQFPLSRSRVVGLVNVMAMVLAKKRQFHTLNMSLHFREWGSCACAWVFISRLTSSAGVSLCTDRSLTVLWNKGHYS